MRNKVFIQLAPTDADHWLTFKSVAELSRYWDPWKTYHRALLKAVKRRDTYFRGYRLQYIEIEPIEVQK